MANKFLKTLFKPNNPVLYLVIFGVIYLLYPKFREQIISILVKLLELITNLYLSLRTFLEDKLNLTGITGILLIILIATFILVLYQKKKITEPSTLFRR